MKACAKHSSIKLKENNFLAKKIFKLMDTNEDKKIDFNEFLDFMYVFAKDTLESKLAGKFFLNIFKSFFKLIFFFLQLFSFCLRMRKMRNF